MQPLNDLKEIQYRGLAPMYSYFTKVVPSAFDRSAGGARLVGRNPGYHVFVPESPLDPAPFGSTTTATCCRVLLRGSAICFFLSTLIIMILPAKRFSCASDRSPRA